MGIHHWQTPDAVTCIRSQENTAPGSQYREDSVLSAGRSWDTVSPRNEADQVQFAPCMIGWIPSPGFAN